LVAGQGAALEQSVAAALSANDEALLADYVQRQAAQGDRGQIDAGDRPPSEGSRHRSGPARNPIRRINR
jgi:hypothetical protein